jgi:hypothetical protein
MTGRRLVAGLSLLCALVFCALMAPSAMAVKGTTAVTCKPEPNPGKETLGFSDEHCTKGAEGTAVKWVHEGITPAVKTQLEVSNSETGAVFPPTKLKFTAEKVEVELEAASFASCLGHTAVENKDNGEKPMEAIIPEFCGEFTKVVVKKGEGCVVLGEAIGLPTGAGERGSGKSVVVNNGGKEEMYVEFIPAEKKPFATFTLEKCKVAGLNKTYKLEGSVRANVSTNEAQLDGPTLRVTTEQTGKTLKVVTGESKLEGKLEGTFTVRMQLNGSEANNPVALTTTK